MFDYDLGVCIQGEVAMLHPCFHHLHFSLENNRMQTWQLYWPKFSHLSLFLNPSPQEVFLQHPYPLLPPPCMGAWEGNSSQLHSKITKSTCPDIRGGQIRSQFPSHDPCAWTSKIYFQINSLVNVLCPSCSLLCKGGGLQAVVVHHQDHFPFDHLLGFLQVVQGWIWEEHM